MNVKKFNRRKAIFFKTLDNGGGTCYNKHTNNFKEGKKAMEIVTLLHEYGAELITAIFDVITIILVVKNKPKTAEQVQAIKKKQAEALSKKAERYAEKTRKALTAQAKIEEELEK